MFIGQVNHLQAFAPVTQPARRHEPLLLPSHLQPRARRFHGGPGACEMPGRRGCRRGGAGAEVRGGGGRRGRLRDVVRRHRLCPGHRRPRRAGQPATDRAGRAQRGAGREHPRAVCGRCQPQHLSPVRREHARRHPQQQPGQRTDPAWRLGAGQSVAGGIQGALGAASSQLAIDSIGKEIARTDLPLGVKTALVAAAGTAIGMAVGGEAGAAAGFNATANNYLSGTDLRNRRQAVADCNGSSSCVTAIQRVSQETTLANNARVLDACQGSGGDCGSAIGKAQQDRADLQAYRQGLVTEQSESTDVANRNAIAVQIMQTDAQIHSADTAIADGKLIRAGGNYSLAGLTAEERVAIGFALDPLGAAGIKALGRIASLAGNTVDNAAYANEQNAAAKKDLTASNQQRDDGSQFDQYRLKGSIKKGGDWDWQTNAPNNGALPGTTTQYPVKAGDVLDRYGSPMGTYLAPSGTTYAQRALAPGSQANNFNQYEVVKPISVERSKVAPAFSQQGGGYQIQYFIPEVSKGPATVLDLLKFGYLRKK